MSPRGVHLALRTVSSQHRMHPPHIRRTTQGGPPSGDRKCGTGGGLALLRGDMTVSDRWMDIE